MRLPNNNNNVVTTILVFHLASVAFGATIVGDDDRAGLARVANTTRKVDSLTRVLDFYNTDLLRVYWDSVRGNVSDGCVRDVQRYIEGLEEAKQWALKSKWVDALQMKNIAVFYLLKNIFFSFAFVEIVM